jgi:hypothetical protein
MLTVAMSTGWSVGLILGIVVIAVAAVIVIVILYLAPGHDLLGSEGPGTTDAVVEAPKPGPLTGPGFAT